MINAAAVRKGWVTLEHRASPEPLAVARYDEAFATYKRVYPALRESMHALAASRQSSGA